MFQTSKLKPSIVKEIRTGAVARLSAEPAGPTDLTAPCAAKMTIEDGYFEYQFRLFSKHRLIYEYKRGVRMEQIFTLKNFQKAGVRLYEKLIMDIEFMFERCSEKLDNVFGWTMRRPRWRYPYLRYPVPPLRTARKKATIPPSPYVGTETTRSLRAYDSAGDYQI
jgi:hypothetical protein